MSKLPSPFIPSALLLWIRFGLFVRANAFFMTELHKVNMKKQMT